MPYLMSQGPLTTDQSLQILMKQQATLSQNPTDYVSPQSAIAAGLDPTTVNTAWKMALAKYQTQQDAISAGIAPTVITQYWQASRAYVALPAPPTLFTPKNLLIGGGLLLGLSLLSKHEKGGA